MPAVIKTIVPVIALIASAGILLNSNIDCFSVTIRTQHQVVKSGDDCRLVITITNTSSREISFGEVPGVRPAAEFQTFIEVRDSQGRSAPDTEYARRLRRNPRPSGSRVTWTLRPGESFEEDAALKKLFDLSRPGKYTISAYRQIPEHLGTGTVKSNTVSLVVTP